MRSPLSTKAHTTRGIMARSRVLAAALGILGVASGCAASTPLLHPAHTLEESEVDMGLGMTQSFTDASTRAAINAAQAAAAPEGAPISEQEFFEGALRGATIPLELSAVAVGRVGLGGHYEAGLTATGRAIRIDARHALQDEQFAFSFGAGASGIYRLGEAKPGQESSIVGRYQGDAVGYGAGGFGFDVPLLVGWRLPSKIVSAWGGVRGGYERMWGGMNLADVAGTAPSQVADVASDRWFGGGLLGASVGVAPVWFRLEFEVAYQGVSGSAEFPDSAGNPQILRSSFDSVTLTPSAGIIGNF